VNHVSLFALVIGFLTLVASKIRKSADLRALAVILFVVGGIFAWIAVETGESAADVVKALGGGSESFINEHALAATWAERSGLFVASLAILMEWAIRKKKSWAGKLQWALLVFALHGCTVFARTAYLGGFVRHTEIRN
jgi:hypothetical protein